MGLLQERGALQHTVNNLCHHMGVVRPILASFDFGPIRLLILPATVLLVNQ